jgi:hypothetical protein
MISSSLISAAEATVTAKTAAVAANTLRWKRIASSRLKATHFEGFAAIDTSPPLERADMKHRAGRVESQPARSEGGAEDRWDVGDPAQLPQGSKPSASRLCSADLLV